jgi:hypothetical protein
MRLDEFDPRRLFFLQVMMICETHTAIRDIIFVLIIRARQSEIFLRFASSEAVIRHYPEVGNDPRP